MKEIVLLEMRRKIPNHANKLSCNGDVVVKTMQMSVERCFKKKLKIPIFSDNSTGDTFVLRCK